MQFPRGKDAADARVIALVGPSLRQESSCAAKLLTALQADPRHRVISATSANDLRTRCVSCSPDAIVIATAGWKPEELAQSIDRLTGEFPSASLLVLLRLTPEDARQLMAVARAGVAEALFESVDRERDMVMRIGQALDSRLSTEGWTHECIESLELCRTGRAFAVMSYVFTSVQKRQDVRGVADYFSVSRRTLHNWFAREDLPSPATLIAWARLLRASLFLVTRRATVETVALQFGFGSSANFRRCLWRHARLRVQDVREHGSPRSLVARLLSTARTEASVSNAGVSRHLKLGLSRIG